MQSPTEQSKQSHNKTHLYYHLHVLFSKVNQLRIQKLDLKIVLMKNTLSVCLLMKVQVIYVNVVPLLLVKFQIVVSFISTTDFLNYVAATFWLALQCHPRCVIIDVSRCSVVQQRLKKFLLVKFGLIIVLYWPCRRLLSSLFRP